MKRERETKSKKKPSNSIEVILPQASNNVKTRFYWAKWNMKGVSWTKWDERMTIESKNDENNSGNLYLKQNKKNGVYSLHLASLYAINVWHASELSKVGTVMSKNHWRKSCKPHEQEQKREQNTRETESCLVGDKRNGKRPETGWSWFAEFTPFLELTASTSYMCVVVVVHFDKMISVV